MPEQLRVGLVGTGFIGSVHARAIRSTGAQLVAVAASSPDRAREAGRRLRVDTVFDTGLELVTADVVDVVHVAAPNDVHAELSLAALSAGKHVVCEKPLALSVGDAEQMATGAEQRGLIGAVPFVNRFYPMAREARSRVREGGCGVVHTMHGSYLQDWLLSPESDNWRVDARRGGASRAFADIGSHWCDLAEWITADRITELVATTSTVLTERPPGGHPVGTEDVATVLFRTARGVTGVLTVSQVAAGRKNQLRIEVDGTEQSVCFDQSIPDQLWIGGSRESRVVVSDPECLGAEARPYALLPPGHAQGFHDCFDAFVADVYRSIDQGAPVDGLPTFADGARSARIVEAVLASADKHAWTEV